MADETMFIVSMTGVICLILGTWSGYTFTILTEKVMERKAKKHGSK